MNITTSTTQQTPQERSTEFVPVEGGSEATGAGTLLVAAYLLMWAALLGFVFLTWRRLTRTEATLAELEAALRKVDKG